VLLVSILEREICNITVEITNTIPKGILISRIISHDSFWLGIIIHVINDATEYTPEMALIT
jgi:hypothetical protein